jgi:hypothetical protein
VALFISGGFMYNGFYEEGDGCPELGCNGKLVYGPVENCSCHISAPCNSCVENPLVCNICHYTYEPPPFTETVELVCGDLMIKSIHLPPRPLDPTKIDYRTHPHTHFSMIKEGVYPPGVTLKEVEAVVKGTFGGRFESFKDGKFKYIAYTD